jgi:hypothetical protein
MKDLKGIFDACSERLSPDLPDKAGAIRDMMIYQSGPMSRLDRIKDQAIEDMALPYEGISLPLELPIGKPLYKAMPTQIPDGFDLPGFSKDAMAADVGEFFKNGISDGVKEQVDKHIPDDFMDLEALGQKTPANSMNMEKPANKFSDDTMEIEKTASGKKDDDMNMDKPRNEEPEDSKSEEEALLNEFLDMF